MSIGIWNFKAVCSFKPFTIRPSFILTIIIYLSGPAAYGQIIDYPNVTARLITNTNAKTKIIFTSEHDYHYELAITKPDETDRLIYGFTSLQSPPLNPNNINNYGRAGSVQLDIDTLVGLYYNNGQIKTAKVFDVPGLYCLHFSTNLETEIENSFFILLGFQWPSPQAVQEGQFYDECIQREW